MNSDDVFVEISGQKYCLDGETLRPAEKDFQSEVLKRLDGIESRLEKVEQRLGVLEYDVTVIKHDQAALQTSVYWVLAAIGIFIAGLSLPSIIASLASAFRRPVTSKDEPVNFTISLTDLIAQALKAEHEKKE